MPKKYYHTFYMILLLIFTLLFQGCKNGPDSTKGPDASGSSPSETSASKSDANDAADPAASENSDSSFAAPSTTGKLHVSGVQLTGEHGEPVQLRGISTHGLAWFPDYVNEDCFSQLRHNWNANVIRLAMYTAESGGYCTDGSKEDLKNLIRSGVRYAASQDLYVIVDWHILSDSNPNTYLEESKAFFGELSAEFAGQNHVLYEICNEPNGSASWNDIKTYAENIIPVIRANDPEAVILVGTPNWSQYVDQAAADPITEYDNLMYSLHFYAATHKEDLRSRMVSALSSGLPIFVTEYGICDASGNGTIDISQADQWVAEMNQYKISYVAWNLSNKNESSALLKSSCTKTSGFSQEDLSQSGQWFYQMLTGNSAGTENTSFDSSRTLTDASGGLTVTLTIVNSWETEGLPYNQYSLSLQNTSGSACTEWAVDLPFETAFTFSDGWNGNYSVEGKTLHITSKDYNGSIPADGAISDIGFIISGGTF